MDLGMSARSTFRAPKSVELAEKLKEGSLVKNNSFQRLESIRSQSGAEFYYFHGIIFRSRNTCNLTLKSEIGRSRISLVVMDLRLRENM